MKLLCAVDREWAIGNKGDLLFHIPDDLKRFRSMTKSNVIIMGRKTFESLPNGEALEDRINIVLTRNKEYKADKAIVLNSIDELLEKVEDYKEKGKEVYLIGGGELVKQLIGKVDKAYITKINRLAEESDTEIPNLDFNREWILEDISETYNHKGTQYRYNIYRRI